MTPNNIFGDFVRGLNTLLQSLWMFTASAIKVVLISIMASVIVAIGVVYSNTTSDERYVAGKWAWAWVLDNYWFGESEITLEIKGESYQFPSSYFVNQPYVIDTRNRAVNEIIHSAKSGEISGIVFAIALAGLSFYRGHKLRKEKTIRGVEIVSARKLARMVRKQKLATDLYLGEVPVPANTETSHFFISGTTRAGKTQLMFSISDVVRARGQAAVVYDSTGEYVRKYFRDGDIILGDDGRSPPWGLWGEIRHPADALRLAVSFVQQAVNAAEQFWVVASQRLFASVLLSIADKPNRTIYELLKLMSNPSPDALAEAVKGLPIGGIMSSTTDRENKLAHNVRGSLLPYLDSLLFLPALSKPSEELSLRRFVESIDKTPGPKPWIYLLSRADNHEAMKPLFSTWLDCIAAALMSLPPDQNRRLWFFADEIQGMQKLVSVPKLCAESRKHGAVCVLGMQNMHQLREIYGHEGAESLASLCGTHVIFRNSSPATSTWLSGFLGEREVEETKESFTYASRNSRNGIQISEQRQTRANAIGSEISRLKDLHFFVKLSGDYPIAKTSISFKERLNRAPAYVESDTSKTGWVVCRQMADSKSNTSSPSPVSFDTTEHHQKG